MRSHGWIPALVLSAVAVLGGVPQRFPISYLPSSISLPNGASMANSYDSLARLRLTALNNFWGHTLDGYAYTPDPLGLRTNITRMFGLGTNSVAVGYDNLGQITSWQAFEATGTPRQNEQLSFAYDAAHNLQIRTNGGLTQTFNCDAENELTSVTWAGTFTLAGSLSAPATNLTVNGLPAQIYSDLTFARTNLTLASGNNSFTNIARNLYGTNTTNITSAYLPSSVSFASDLNGSLTNDGLRSFFYDSEDQISNVTVAAAWKTDFIHDGLRRLRIERDYGWLSSSSSWSLTNELHYIYVGFLLVQVRDGNNNLLWTLTRGLDLSQTLGEAGGIGGLLARTDGNGSTFYHSDGPGNITALMDGSENIAARYLYGPFGRSLGQWGPMGNANTMRFSSMPNFGTAGIDGYWGRLYDPNLQRWLNRDPTGERADVNLYRFVGNSPASLVDPFGLEAGYTYNPDGSMTGPDLSLQNARNNLAALQSLADSLLNALQQNPLRDLVDNLTGGAVTDLMNKIDPPPPPGVVPLMMPFGPGEFELEDPVKPAKLGPKVEKPCLKPRTPAENKKARSSFKNNKDAARKAWEDRTGLTWPTDENGNPWPAHHPDPIADGGDPMHVEPQNPNGPDPHNIPGPDGLTDYQRWGALGPLFRQSNK